MTQIQQQRPQSPTVTLAWHVCKYKVHKLHQMYSRVLWISVTAHVLLDVIQYFRKATVPSNMESLTCARLKCTWTHSWMAVTVVAPWGCLFIDGKCVTVRLVSLRMTIMRLRDWLFYERQLHVCASGLFVDASCVTIGVTSVWIATACLCVWLSLWLAVVCLCDWLLCRWQLCVYAFGFLYVWQLCVCVTGFFMGDKVCDCRTVFFVDGNCATVQLSSLCMATVFMYDWLLYGWQRCVCWVYSFMDDYCVSVGFIPLWMASVCQWDLLLYCITSVCLWDLLLWWWIYSFMDVNCVSVGFTPLLRMINMCLWNMCLCVWLLYVSVEFTLLWMVAVCLPNLAEGLVESTWLFRVPS